MVINQYEVVLVNLDPTIGSEIKKTRPCAIISPNEMNHHLKTVIMAPMTTKSRKYPSRVPVLHDNKKGWLVIDQIRTIDKARIVKKFKVLSTSEVKQCKAIIKEMLVD